MVLAAKEAGEVTLDYIPIIQHVYSVKHLEHFCSSFVIFVFPHVSIYFRKPSGDQCGKAPWRQKEMSSVEKIEDVEFERKKKKVRSESLNKQRNKQRNKALTS